MKPLDLDFRFAIAGVSTRSATIRWGVGHELYVPFTVGGFDPLLDGDRPSDSRSIGGKFR
jgi:hypothetical protein